MTQATAFDKTTRGNAHHFIMGIFAIVNRLTANGVIPHKLDVLKHITGLLDYYGFKLLIDKDFVDTEPVDFIAVLIHHTHHTAKIAYQGEIVATLKYTITHEKSNLGDGKYLSSHELTFI